MDMYNKIHNNLNVSYQNVSWNWRFFIGIFVDFQK